MDEILNSTHIDTKHYDPINWCCMYMKALFVSDISSAAGKHLAEYFNQKELPEMFMYAPTMDWPQQGKPNTESWRIYTGILRKILCRSNGQLKTPLRKWIQDDNKWLWRFHSASNTLYHSIIKKWYKHNAHDQM
eukprot:885509-Ditylum_brightwellii.AAC.2